MRRCLQKRAFSLDEETQIYTEFFTYYNKVAELVQLFEVEKYPNERRKEFASKLLAKSVIVSYFFHSSSKWVKFVLEHKQIPPPFVKKFQAAAEVFLKMARAPNKFDAWWKKNFTKFELLVDAKEWSIKKEDSEEKYKIEPFTIHNTLHLSDDDLLKTNASVEAAIKFLKSSGLPKISQVLYGDVFIVGRLLQSGTMAWYYIQEDKIYLRPLLKFGRGEVHNLIHEIGHRYYRKVLSPIAKKDWDSYFIKLRFSDGGTLSPKQEEDLDNLKKLKVGDVFPVPISGMKRGGPLLVKEIVQTGSDYNWGITFVVWNSRGTAKISLREIINHWKKSPSSKYSKFPTDYSSTSQEEFFCEAFAMYAMKDLPSPWNEKFQEIVG